MRTRVVLGVALLLAACGPGEDGSPATAVVRDSAGIVIVESAVPRWTSETAWRVSEEPSLVIGTVEGVEAQQLYEVGDVATLPGGSIAVVNRGVEVRVFDAAGAHLRTLGGEGEGPGEFVAIAGIATVGDTILVYDSHAARLTRFTTEGRLLGVETLETGGGTIDPYSHRLAGLWDPDGVALETWAFDAAMRDPPAAYWDSVPNLLYGTDGAFRDTLGRFGGMEMFAMQDRSTFRPFGRITASDVGPDGFYIGDGATLEYEVYGSEGLRRIVRGAVDSRPVTEALIEELVVGPLRRRIDDADVGPAQAREALDFYDGIDYPDAVPVYSDLHVDPEGYVWLQSYRWRGERGPTDWYVFDAKGTWLGTVTVPRRLFVASIGTDHVLGSWSDELGVEYVLRYAVLRPEG